MSATREALVARMADAHARRDYADLSEAYHVLADWLVEHDAIERPRLFVGIDFATGDAVAEVRCGAEVLVRVGSDDASERASIWLDERSKAVAR